ncbi:MAG: glycine cleavage system protein GcvH [Clostridiaceae bacterium]|nr:glycine cleavage system protein GcvH [Clostridiaceae bacterium]
MNFPSELKYSKSHEWVKMLDDQTALVGITDFAQSEMGDLVFINLPVVGDAVEKETVLCDIESVKAVSDVMSPLTGTVAEINESLLDTPEKLNEDPYGSWIAKIEAITDTEELMDAADYEAFTKA